MADSKPGADPERALADKGRGPLESAFQEIVRRAATLGFSSLFLTEEAIRKALADSVPKEWAEYVAQQSGDVRKELFDRMLAEFSAWLQRVDPSELQQSLMQTLLENYELKLKIEIVANPREDAAEPSLRVLSRRD